MAAYGRKLTLKVSLSHLANLNWKALSSDYPWSRPLALSLVRRFGVVMFKQPDNPLPLTPPSLPILLL
ncbi:hypothetical protein GCM10009038_26420 [Salinicola rhizosphaerae]|uniref:Uncharacterized protein n=1 Tax=Salinicola rhizosphaerae TaxID=1443141 RepID=A0ABQ3E4S6_9GAMM|nr:hypothetical protein GCM10009038_26420 [Salinicola rhizosphaerae]